jgi:hypothetical protein
MALSASCSVIDPNTDCSSSVALVEAWFLMRLSAVIQRERKFDEALWRRCRIAFVVLRKRHFGPAWTKFRALGVLQRIVLVTAALTIFHFGVGLVAYIYEALFQMAYDPTLRRLVSEAFFLGRSGRCMFPLVGASLALSMVRTQPKLGAIILGCVLSVMGAIAAQDFATQDWDYWMLDDDGTPTNGKYLTWWWFPQ